MQPPPIDSRPLWRSLLQLTWPTLVAQAAVMLYSIIDTLMAGRISALDLAAVGIGASMYATLFITLMGVLFAMTPIVAHHYGAGRRREIGADVRQSLWLAVVLALLSLLMLNYPQPLLWLSRLEPETEVKVRAYLAAVSWGVPGVLLFRVFFGLTTGIGRPRPVMVLNLIGLAIKILLNLVLMFGAFGLPAMGAVGAGMSTAISMWALALLSWWWCRREPTYADYGVFEGFDWPNWPAQRELLRQGLPIAGAFLIDVSTFTLMALFIARLGALWSAAHQIAASLAVFCFIAPLSLGHATSVLVGQSLGAGNHARAAAAARLGVRVALLWGLVVAALIVLNAPALAAAFTTDIEVRRAAVPLIMLLAIFQWGDAAQGVISQVLRGYKRPLAAMVILVLPMWGVGLAGGYVLALTDWLGPPLGARGFWITESAGMMLAAAGMWIYFRHIAQIKTEAD